MGAFRNFLKNFRKSKKFGQETMGQVDLDEIKHPVDVESEAPHSFAQSLDPLENGEGAGGVHEIDDGQPPPGNGELNYFNLANLTPTEDSRNFSEKVETGQRAIKSQIGKFALKPLIHKLAVLLILAGVVSASLVTVFLVLQPIPSTSDDDDDNGIRYVPRSQGSVNIYVNSSIYASILDEIDQYKQDIMDQGYKVEVINWSILEVGELKQNLTTYYTSNRLVGAVLVGELPYAMARYLMGPPINQNEYYPCDLYLMDLDGNWTDINNNNIFDLAPNPEHNNLTGDEYPEIWIARINPNPINGINYLAAYKNYFKQNHLFRNGSLTRPHKALLYIDDEWSAERDEWLSNFTAYTGFAVDCYSDDPTTNSTNYLANLTVNYELVHLLVNSNSTDQLFVDGIVNFIDINNTNPLPVFYNLYSDYACNFTYTDNIGTHYLFSNNTLTVIGCARSGGMCEYKPFYDALKNGKTIGEAFRLWFFNPEILTQGHWPEVYGMTILGDPLLTISSA